MTEIRITGEKLLAIGADHMSESEMKTLVDTEARVLGKLIVANVRMQCKIYKVLSPEQQKKLSDLERNQSAATSDGK